MRAPSTQEEKDYREALSNRVAAIGNIQALFADIEDKARKLEILKSLVKTLNYGDDLIEVIDQEIEAAEQAKEEEKKAAEEEARLAAEGESATKDTPAETEEDTSEDDLDFDLGMSSDAPIAEESLDTENDTQILLEERDILIEEDDLPTPEEANEHKDFSRNE
jgi:hypothetical protein